MEDWNILAADCAVISCCCQCLILQLIIFILVKLPYKLVRKTRDLAKKKLRKKAGKKRKGSPLKGRIPDRIMRMEMEEFFHGHHSCGSYMKDIERVLEELSGDGEFAFGSFWGRKEGSEVTKNESDLSLVQFELVEIIHSFKH